MLTVALQASGPDLAYFAGQCTGLLLLFDGPLPKLPGNQSLKTAAQKALGFIEKAGDDIELALALADAGVTPAKVEQLLETATAVEKAIHTAAPVKAIEKTTTQRKVLDNLTKACSKPSQQAPPIKAIASTSLFHKCEHYIQHGKEILPAFNDERYQEFLTHSLHNFLGYIHSAESNAIKAFKENDIVNSIGHMFSGKHEKKGILNLCTTKPEIFDKIISIIKDADKQNLLNRAGSSQIYARINNQLITIRLFIRDHQLLSVNCFPSKANRGLGTVIEYIIS